VETERLGKKEFCSTVDFTSKIDPAVIRSINLVVFLTL
jgi:hypothetical protein